MNIVVAGTKDAIVMVEGGAKEVPEAEIVDALMFAHNSIQEFIKLQEELISGLDVEKRVLEPKAESPIESEVLSFAGQKLRDTLISASKTERKQRIKSIRAETEEHIESLHPDEDVHVSGPFEKILKELVRELIVKDKIRLDGRGYADVRNIYGEVGFLTRAHGSALFTRGETQAAVTATLGTTYDEQRIDSLEGDVTKTFMLHYNFPLQCGRSELQARAGTQRDRARGARREVYNPGTAG